MYFPQNTDKFGLMHNFFVTINHKKRNKLYICKKIIRRINY